MQNISITEVEDDKVLEKNVNNKNDKDIETAKKNIQTGIDRYKKNKNKLIIK
jgi:hypothetical protein